MAKKDNIKPLYLFVGGTLLFGLAWLMPSYPLLAFLGLAPFIAIAVNNRKEKSMWTSLELVLLGLTISFFAGTFFSITELAFTATQAILFTMPFIGYTFVRKVLGTGVSIITFPLFWLSMEYILLKCSPYPTIYLADLLALKPEWTSWNHSTGYLGSSLWILVTNTLLFQGILTDKKVNWVFITLFIACIASPIVYSYTLETHALTKNDMLQLYASPAAGLSNYQLKGELIPRTAAWISVLILLFTFVKGKTSRK
jgi:hypothetical protein